MLAVVEEGVVAVIVDLGTHEVMCLLLNMTKQAEG